MAEEERIADLILKQLRHTLSEEEKEALDAWANASDANREFIARRTGKEYVMSAMKAMLKKNDKTIYRKFRKLRKKVSMEAPVLHSWGWYLGRAAIFILPVGLLTVTLLYLFRDKAPAVSKTTPVTQDPEAGRVTLTLRDGTPIYLDKMASGSHFDANDWRIIKIDSQHIAYAAYSPAKGGTMDGCYHMLSTPYGQSFYVSLPDKSVIQLGAGTSVKYPVRGARAMKGERAVMLNGEAFFTVTKNKDAPFIVSTKKAKVTVLSTDFSVHDYPGESEYLATVVKGAIVVSDGKSRVYVEAGEAAKMDKTLDGIQKLATYDTTKGLAWRSKFFDFAHLNLRQSMEQIKRWYGKDGVVIKPGVDTVSKGVLGVGLISKSGKLDNLLYNIGQAHQLHFDTLENKIIVGPR